MLSMFKDKKGFSVLFNSGGEQRPAAVPETSAPRRRADQLPTPAARLTGRDLAQFQCQRCSKRFSALEEEDGGGGSAEAASQCHRCGYATCPPCREPVAAGGPVWACCVCHTSRKSLMWLLEKTQAGPLLVTTIVEYCDPRGQRLMRSMFRFALQQYHAVTPRPSAVLAERAGSGAAGSHSRPASQTPPASLVSKARTSSRLSGERGGARLAQVSQSHSNARRPSPYTHPKHASLLRTARRSSSTAGGGAGADVRGVDKENEVEVPRRTGGSEMLRRTEEAVRVVEYSPEAAWRVRGDAEGSAAGAGERAQSQSPCAVGDAAHRTSPLPEDRCAAVADVYGAGTHHAHTRGDTSRHVVATTAAAAEVASPHTRPSGRAVFQREALPLQHIGPHAVDTAAAAAEADTNAPAVAAAPSCTASPRGQPCCLGRSLSPASSGSGRSASPAPRFPTFGQFLDDHTTTGATQMFFPRESDVLVTVSPATDEDNCSDGGGNSGAGSSCVVVELGGGVRRGDRLAATTTGGHGRSGPRTPRGVLPHTPPSASGPGDSPFARSSRRTSGWGDITPTRMLDMSSARATLQLRGSSGRRTTTTTRGSLREIHAPHLYGGGGAAGGSQVRRSGQQHESAFMSELPSQFSAHARPADTAHGQQRRQQVGLATRTAGRALCGDGRQRLARQDSRTTTPLQRTASRVQHLQRVPSRTGVLARTNSSTAQLTRTNSSSFAGRPGFARTNSSTAHTLDRGPLRHQHPTRNLTGRGRLQRTESSTLVRSGSSYGGVTCHSPRGAAAGLERTYSGYGGAASLHASPLKRPLPPSTALLRTASASSFTRSATVHAAFTRTVSAAVVGGAAPPRPVAGAFARTATGTHLPRRAGEHAGVAPRVPPLPRPQPGAGAQPSSARRAEHNSHRVAGASPLRRVPTPTALSRSGTAQRNFERQASHAGRERVWQSSAGARRTVDPAPTLVGGARRKVVGAALHRTSSSTATPAPVVATPRTPRPYLVTSVSTAATAAAVVTGTVAQSGRRPVLTSGASSPKCRSSIGSRTSGCTTRNSNEDTDAASGAVRASVQRRRPATAARERPPARAATPKTRGTAATTFARQQSRPHLL
ncbi:hypothetical protein NESM_000250600 [Novymonas esmeraldas]|uniref:Uncharacterized protein n=1 Tax=Novymonas esmeraldas TaxID=1808958 RepID=A0AAW0F9W6_9TRYP